MRLLIVSNRLPVTVKEENGNLTFSESAGGVATGLTTFLKQLDKMPFGFSDYIWIGWPGGVFEDRMKKTLKRSLLANHRCHPVFLSEVEMDNFYEGFCNDTIWPLFHYFPAFTEYNDKYWNYYKKVNAIFMNAVQEVIKPGDLVWVHDYHLMLLPELLRKKYPDMAIGYFLHIPFPSYEIYRLLPGLWRGKILDGILGADLVGFHTLDYNQYFVRSVIRALSYEIDIGTIMLDHRLVKVDTFPMGIDYNKFHTAFNDSETRRIIDGYRKMLGDSRIILSMDRLDYTKGILNRLEGYEMFLERNPEWQGRVVLICIVVPSRTGVEQYQQMKRQIDEIIGKINGRFGNINWTPILYQFKNNSFKSIAALYHISDVALVTPLRDGMNLIAKEYIATRTEQTGVLILSEMAGAAKEMGEAILINPFYVEEIADAMKQALEMPKLEQIKRNQAMQTRLERYNVMKWAEDFVSTLLNFKSEQQRINLKLLAPNIMKQIISSYRSSKNRLIFLDYDGTLVPFANSPQKAEPDEQLVRLLIKLSNVNENEIIIISGRDKTTLQNWFGSINVSLIAEHGAWIRGANEDWKMLKQLTNDWKPSILPILEMYTDRLTGSFIEHKEFSLVWHYRNADPDLSSERVRELIGNLMDYTAQRDLQITEGHKVVEIKNAGINKGVAAQYFIATNKADFIMAIGDDRTDEDLFKALPEGAYSIKVGLTKSYARFNMESYNDVRRFLEKMLL